MDWKRIAQLVKQTGERCVVFDAESDEPLVIMPLSEFEALSEMWCCDEGEDQELENGFSFEGSDASLPADLPLEPESMTWYPDEHDEMMHRDTQSNQETVDEEPWYIEPVTDTE